jgi:hypothetical protein
MKLISLSVVLIACMLAPSATIQPATAASALPPLTVSRIKFADNLYYTVHCRVSSGNFATDAKNVLDAVGIVVTSVGGVTYTLIEAGVVAVIKAAALHQGTAYCTGWVYSDPAKINLKSAPGAMVTERLYIGDKKLIERVTDQECNFFFCITRGLPGGSSVDGMTACVEVEGKSAVVAMGNAINKVDNQNTKEAQPGKCGARKF